MGLEVPQSYAYILLCGQSKLHILLFDFFVEKNRSFNCLIVSKVSVHGWLDLTQKCYSGRDWQRDASYLMMGGNSTQRKSSVNQDTFQNFIPGTSSKRACLLAIHSTMNVSGLIH